MTVKRVEVQIKRVQIRSVFFQPPQHHALRASHYFEWSSGCHSLSKFLCRSYISGCNWCVTEVGLHSYLTFKSTGYNGVSVWDTINFDLVKTPPLTDGLNVFTSLTWIYFADNSVHVLLLGSLTGSIHAWEYDREKHVNKKQTSFLFHAYPFIDLQGNQVPGS